MDFLAAKDIAGDQAVSLLLDVVAVDRAKAVKLLPLTWSLRDKAALLGLTHGEGVLAPAYVLIYEDMVTQNLAMQVVDGWSFDRAKEVFSETKIDRETLKSFFERRGASSYMKKMIQVSGKGLPYEPPANVVLRKGSQLTFGNNVMFDLSTGLAFFQGPDGPMAIRSVFKKDGEWAARVPPFGNSAIAAMIIPQEDTFVCVTAHSDLVRSMLFKLTYLKGQGLAHFEPVVSRGSILNRDYVLIYRIHWDD